MNDTFLYRLRTEPPEPFATQLKERLDRSARRGARALRFGLGALLFGTAFAMVSPAARHSVVDLIDWVRGTPAPTSQTADPNATPATGRPRVASPSADANRADVAGPDIESQVREGTRALLETEQARRRVPVTLPPLRPAPPVTLPGSSPANETAADAGSASDSATGAPTQNGFIVTGPLLAEVGTPAYLFQVRRGYFTVMEWTMKPLDDMARRHAPLDQNVAKTATYRLMELATMMNEMFAKDERNSDVPTRSQPAIWERKREFLQEQYTFFKAVQGLLNVVKSQDRPQLPEQILRVDQACASCHERFRKGGNSEIGAVFP